MKKKTDHKKLLLTVALLTLTIFFYMVIGAVVFSLAESDYNITSQRRLLVSIIDFVNEHPCWNNESIQQFFLNVSDAVSGNVISATRRARIREANSLWDMPNSFFFASTIVTTIGYGNFVPLTTGGRIFCSFYALFGIPLAGGFLFFIGVALQGTWQKIRHNIHRLTTCIPSNRARHFVHVILYFIIVLAVELLLPGLVFTFTEGWSFADSFYYCFISLSTIGFGDMVAGDTHDDLLSLWLLKVALVMYLLMGLCVMSMALKALADSQKKGIIRAKTVARTAVKRILVRASGEKNSQPDQREQTVQAAESAAIENQDADSQSGAMEYGGHVD
ncbi:potassium channel subfamily K member 2-like [Diadema setosum]|uniref:potassium channel subfamily K member 2-like n=1 Tax=Diadema setosum TaxID=31175 RepID=UPI003B3A3094